MGELAQFQEVHERVPLINKAMYIDADVPKEIWY